MKITVTTAHIQSATPRPNSSPIALALRDMGYADATVTHRYAYFNQGMYQLPEAAIASERCFDYLAKGGFSQGEIADNIYPYEFELGAKINV